MMGQNVSHFSILEKLGEGGMGVVYKARDTKLDRIVALKFLPPHLTANDAEKARLLQEAKAASSLNHPNVCTIYGIEEFEQHQFIEMEYVEGETLRRKVPVKKSSDLLAYAIQIGDALHEAHTKGIVHRDIKCENVMVNTKNQVKVMDFGLAKLNGSLKLTRTSSTVGTLAYMAPEQIQGGEADARSDIFSFGAVLFEMSAGRTPFRGEHDAAMMYSILNEEPDSILKWDTSASPELDRIIKRALEKDPADRFQHVDDMVSEIRRIQKQSGRVSRQSMASIPVQPSSTLSPVYEQPPAQPSQSVAVPQPFMRRFRFPLIGAVLLLCAAVAYYFFTTSKEHTLDSLAVLPFVNVSADPNTEYLSDGMTESIINSLTRIQQLRVIPRSTIFRFKGKDIDPQEVGTKLHVGAVLTGRLVQRGDEITVQLDLIDIQSQSQIWGEQYRRKVADVIPLQEEIIAEVTQKLRVVLSGDTKAELTKRYTENPEAYKLYLQGRYYWNKRRGPDILKAADLLTQAITIDPNYALAYVGLVDCYLIMEQYAGIPAKETAPKAKAAIRKALELDNSLGEAHTTMAFVYQYDWEWEKADEEFKIAMRLNPKYPTLYQWYGIYCARTNRLEEYYTLIQKGLELDPMSPIILLNAGISSFTVKHDYDAALRYFQRAIELDPGFISAYWARGRMYTLQGFPEKGIPDIQKSVEMSGRGAESLSHLGYAYAKMGSHKEAEAILDEMETKYAEGKCAAYLIAEVYAGLGSKDKAFDWLNKDIVDHSGWLGWLQFNPELQVIRDDPRYAELLKKLNFIK